MESTLRNLEFGQQWVEKPMKKVRLAERFTSFSGKYQTEFALADELIQRRGYVWMQVHNAMCVSGLEPIGDQTTIRLLNWFASR